MSLTPYATCCCCCCRHCSSSHILLLLVDHSEFKDIALDTLRDKVVIDTRGVLR